MPGLSYFNGWDTAPEELFQSAVVKCRMEQMIEESWIKVTILEAIPLQEVSKRFPAVDNGENSAWRVTECENLFEYKYWTGLKGNRNLKLTEGYFYEIIFL